MIRPGELKLDERRLEIAWWGPPLDNAPTLVLLHEGLGCVGLWRDVPERLANTTGCAVFAYSRFGYGQSDTVALPRPMTYMHEEALDVLPRVLAAAGIHRFFLIGHSDGGSIAAIYAGGVQNESLVGVVTIAAHFFVEELNITSIRQIRHAYEHSELRDRLARYHREVDAAFYGWNDAWLDPRFRTFDITDYLRRISVPVLGLQGADDPYGTDEQLHVLERMVQAPIETRLIHHARHSPHLEERDETLGAITTFVAECEQESRYD
ncbi:MAG: alpha/beta hydrolase [Acetobacteraceae bacterium]|nr:alpha/beta hydrolase [Acetobacteraceae bacterium]